MELGGSPALPRGVVDTGVACDADADDGVDENGLSSSKGSFLRFKTGDGGGPRSPRISARRSGILCASLCCTSLSVRSLSSRSLSLNVALKGPLSLTTLFGVEDHVLPPLLFCCNVP